MLTHQIKRQGAIGLHSALIHSGGQRAVELQQRLSRTACTQIDPAQPGCDRRMARINFSSTPEKTDRRLQIIHPQRRLPGFDKRITIARRLGQSDQRAVQPLDFIRRQRLHHRARHHVLRLRRPQRKQRSA